MNGKIKIELDRYEIGIVINALVEYRNQTIEKEMSTDGIDDLLIKFNNIYEKVCPLIKSMKKEYAR